MTADAGPPRHVPTPGRRAAKGLAVGQGAPRDGAADFVTVAGPDGVARLYAPLAGLDPNNPLLGGFAFLDKTDNGQTYHCGVDLNAAPAGRVGAGGCNADLGLDVVAPLGGVVRFVGVWDEWTPGEGNHLWLELTDPLAPAPTWVHFDHLEGFAVGPGERVAAGQLVGWCGQSGRWPCAHLHTELLPAAPTEWTQWPRGWTREQVEAAYYRPRDWWQAASAKVQGASEEATMAILSGAQTAAVQAVVWGDQWNPAASEFAIPASWRDEWRAGRWRGAPLGGEQPIPQDDVEGKSAGSWQLFEGGAACWLPDRPVSWNG